MIGQVIDFFIHLDVHLGSLIRTAGAWTYLFLSVTIFCETGLVVTPFLPGDSLLFAAGAFAAAGTLDLRILLFSLSAAAVAGNMANYQIGCLAGPKVFHSDRVRLLNRRHLEETHRFFEKWGPITIVLARFLPIIRTFAPFLAGVGRMNYWRFSLYNAVGSLAWVLLFTLGGYFFGNIPAVRGNFSLVILVIVAISVLPSAVAFFRGRAKKAKNA
ncbi:MAG: DedA family protein [Nitrospiraceae bacterium]|nr:DedA family protein [Nitrospiraceae bacterium]